MKELLDQQEPRPWFSVEDRKIIRKNVIIVLLAIITIVLLLTF